MCVIDWKTSQKPRPNLKDIHDYPVQAVAYAGAINDDNNYPFNVSRALFSLGFYFHYEDEMLILNTLTFLHGKYIKCEN